MKNRLPNPLWGAVPFLFFVILFMLVIYNEQILILVWPAFKELEYKMRSIIKFSLLIFELGLFSFIGFKIFLKGRKVQENPK